MINIIHGNIINFIMRILYRINCTIFYILASYIYSCIMLPLFVKKISYKLIRHKYI